MRTLFVSHMHIVQMASNQKNKKFAENGRNAAPAKKARYVCFCHLLVKKICHYVMLVIEMFFHLFNVCIVCIC